MRIQPIQTYLNRSSSIKFTQRVESNHPEESNSNHSPVGVILTAAMIPTVTILTVCNPKAPENTTPENEPDSTVYVNNFNQIMQSPLIEMPKASPEELLAKGYKQLADGTYSNWTHTIFIDSDYYQIDKGDTEYTRPMIDGQGYSNIRINSEKGYEIIDDVFHH